MPHKFLVEYEKQGTRWTRVSTPSCSWEIMQKTKLTVFYKGTAVMGGKLEEIQPQEPLLGEAALQKE